MVYSLTSASALGLDLARTPGGVEAAGVLLRALLAPSGNVPSAGAVRDASAGTQPVTGLPGRAPADLALARSRALALLGPAAPTVVDLTATGSAAEDDGPATDETTATLRRLMRRLGAVSFGTVADLLALAADLPRSSPGPTTDGLSLRVLDVLEADLGQALADAVLAALLLARPEPAAPVLARALTARLDPPAPAAHVLPPAPAPGHALLQGRAPDFARRTAALLARLAAVDDPAALVPAGGPAPHVWAQHMHEATWAVETTGRTRLAAAAQLDLLRCLDAAGTDAALALGGVWNTCSAAVQAHVVADVLDGDSWTVLTADLLDTLDRLEAPRG